VRLETIRPPALAISTGRQVLEETVPARYGVGSSFPRLLSSDKQQKFADIPLSSTTPFQFPWDPQDDGEWRVLAAAIMLTQSFSLTLARP
jgi:hypothetical protein